MEQSGLGFLKEMQMSLAACQRITVYILQICLPMEKKTSLTINPLKDLFMYGDCPTDFGLG